MGQWAKLVGIGYSQASILIGFAEVAAEIAINGTRFIGEDSSLCTHRKQTSAQVHATARRSFVRNRHEEEGLTLIARTGPRMDSPNLAIRVQKFHQLQLVEGRSSRHLQPDTRV